MYVYESVVSLLLSMMCQVERTVSINDDHLMVEEDSKSICVMVEKQRAAAATASTTAALKAVLVAGGMPREEKEKSLCPWVFELGMLQFQTDQHLYVLVFRHLCHMVRYFYVPRTHFLQLDPISMYSFFESKN